jgi:hypothetical protein
MEIINRYALNSGKYKGKMLTVYKPVIPTWAKRMEIWNNARVTPDPVASFPQLDKLGRADFNLVNNGVR